MSNVIMYKMASLAMEKEAKYGSKGKSGIINLYKEYTRALKGYPKQSKNIKESILETKNKLKEHPHDQIYEDLITGSEAILRNMKRQSNIARGATGAAALGGGYGVYRALRKRPEE